MIEAGSFTSKRLQPTNVAFSWSILHFTDYSSVTETNRSTIKQISVGTGVKKDGLDLKSQI
jgi:hypothetical protein